MPRLAELLDRESLAELVPADFASPGDPWIEVAAHLRELGHAPETETHAIFVPGRIEVLGKHTDYAGGRSLIAATEQGFYLAVVPRGDAELRFHDLGRDCRETLALGGELAHRPGRWTAYPLAVARRARRDFAVELGGADVAFTSTLPAAAGLSSSSALVIATWLALAAVNPLEGSTAYRGAIDGRERLAEYLAAVEAGRGFAGLAGDDGVGTLGGSEDHTAILCCRAGHVSQYSYAPVRHERTIAMPEGYVFAIAVSGVRAKKTGAARDAYNRASALAAELAMIWRRTTGRSEPHLAAIAGLGKSAIAELERAIEEAPEGASTSDLLRRLAHFLAESEELVPAGGEALASGRRRALGRPAASSQRLAERLLRNQTPETSFLAAVARDLGAAATSAFGAGFGGAVWALVERDRLQEFLSSWRTGYRERFPAAAERARFFSTGARGGALQVERRDG